MVVFLRSTDGNPDSRLQKYTDCLAEKKLPFKVLCWDRLGKFSDSLIFCYYKRQAAYGQGIKNLFGLIGFNFFVLRQLFHLRKDCKVIHAGDFDTVLPALFMKVFFNKKVIYNIFDWFVDSRNFHNAFLRKVILCLERFALKKADVTIICEEERQKQLCYIPVNLWVLPNIPNFSFSMEKDSQDISRHKTIHIAYVGVFAGHRGLEKIIKMVAENPDLLELDIAGFGELENMVCNASKSSPNIRYHGSVSYREGVRIMSRADIILALYEKTIPNHIYAAPNKYYEGLFLGKPILTTEGTYVGIKTKKYKTGFVIGETLEDMKNFFNSPQLSQQIIEYGRNAQCLWNERYLFYVDTFMQHRYMPFIQN